MPLYNVLQPIKTGGKLHRPGSDPVELDASVADDLVGAGYLSLAQAAVPTAVPAALRIAFPEPPNGPAVTSATETSATVPPKVETAAAKKAEKTAATPCKPAAKKATKAKTA